MLRGLFWIGAALALVLVVLPPLRISPAVATHATEDDALDARADEGSRAAAATISRVVTLDRDGQDKGGIEIAAPRPATFREEVRAYGTVLALDRFVSLYNLSLVDAAQLKAAEVKREGSRAADARARALLAVFPTNRAQVESSAAALAVDEAAVGTAQAQVETLRNSAVQDWGQTLGASLATRDPLAADLVAGRLRLVQLSLQPGRMAAPPKTLVLSLGDAASLEGRFVSIATQVDPRLQAVGYLYAVPAAPGLLPGASVLALLPRGAAEAGLGIPSSAVVWQAGKPWLYLRTAPGRFERRSIDEAAAPTADGGFVVPAKSLPAVAERAMVVAGAQVLLSQEMRAQIPSDEDKD